MKRSILLMSLTVLFAGCQEDYIGQYPVDSDAPAQVSDAQVENIPGGARITYTLPDESDLLYVKAVYKDARGVQKQVKASMFKNQLELKGFARSKKQWVELVSVDRSQNESEPVKVLIEPLDSPIYSIAESLELVPSWGGMKMSWNNPEKEQIFMYVSKPSEEGEQIIETIVSTEAEGKSAVRGLEAVAQDFNVLIRDIYENYTDTLSYTITPLYEIFIESKNFVLMPLATNMNWHKSRNNVGALFDGVKTTDKPAYMETKAKDPETGIPYSYWTVDLGAVYSLSRVKFWGRLPNYAFDLHSPKRFQMWGTTSKEAAANPDNWEGWELLIEDSSHKPSGDDNKDITAEDKAYATAGEEYEIPESCNPLQYFRFVCLETWTASANLNMNEIEFYGAEVK